MIAIAAIATLVVAVLAVPRRSALVPGPALDDSKSEVASSAPTVVPQSSAGSRSALTPVASIAKPETGSHPGKELVKTTETSLQNQVSAPSKRLAAPAPVLDAHDNKATSASPRVDTPAEMVSVPTAAPPATDTAAVAQVTITGCLELTGKDRFRLTDTDGANAPKARSWRTGFLKKHSAAMDLVGAADPAALQKQVGRRVAVTGVQADREIKVSSVRVVSPACE